MRRSQNVSAFFLVMFQHFIIEHRGVSLHSVLHHTILPNINDHYRGTHNAMADATDNEWMIGGGKVRSLAAGALTFGRLAVALDDQEGTMTQVVELGNVSGCDH